VCCAQHCSAATERTRFHNPIGGSSAHWGTMELDVRYWAQTYAENRAIFFKRTSPSPGRVGDRRSAMSTPDCLAEQSGKLVLPL